MNIDSIDLKILNELQRDASLSNVELAKRVHLSASPCLVRVRELERSGLIRQYVALLDAHQLGLHLNVFISISLKQQSRQALQAFEERVCAREEVMECYLMAGEFDYLLRVVVADMADFERLHRDALTRLPGVARVNSSVTIRTVQKKTELPLH